MDKSLSETFEQTLENVLRTHLPTLENNADPVPMDVPLVDLGLDSLRAVSLVLDLEDTFGFEFPDTMLSEATFHTAAALSEAVKSLLDRP